MPRTEEHPARQMGLSTEKSRPTTVPLPYPSPHKKVRTVTRPAVREAGKRRGGKKPLSDVAVQRSAERTVSYEDVTGDLYGVGGDNREDMFRGADLANAASIVQSSEYEDIQGSEEDLLHYVDAVQSASVGFTQLHRRLFVVEGWDRVKRQGTVSTGRHI
jgi:hypothetical protein